MSSDEKQNKTVPIQRAGKLTANFIPAEPLTAAIPMASAAGSG